MGDGLTRRRLLGGAGGAAAAGLSHRWFGRASPAGAAEAAWCSLDPAGEGTASVDAPTAATAGLPEEVGLWSDPMRVRYTVIGVHAVLVRTGKVLLVESSHAALWNPADNTARRVNPPVDLFCSGHCVLGDGRVFFAGGAKIGPPPNWTAVFDPVSETWERGPDMRQGRWYPTTTTLPDGQHVLITTGDIDRSGAVNEDVEVFSAADGTLSVVGTRHLGLYPHQHMTPDGRVLVAGPAPIAAVLDPTDWSWSDLPPLLRTHHNGGAVLLPAGPDGPHELMVVGSTFRTGAMVEAFDTLAPEEGWRRRAPLPAPRGHMNLVLLPDGTVLGVGGAHETGNVHRSLLYDPVADTWTPMAAQARPRGYHSTALLLPDGRVLSAGDNIAPGGMHDLEVYSPPYLFRGERPRMHRPPASTTWGATFQMRVLGSVARAVLVSPGAVTHTNDMAQRHVELVIGVADGVATITAPPSAAVAPVGYHLLFLIDADGVPSKGAWLHVGP